MKIIRERDAKKLIQNRNRLYKRAKREYEEAKNLFQVGSLDFADSLQLAYKHYGAAEAITYTLDSIGYVEPKKLTAKEKRIIKNWCMQKGIALLIILISVLSLIVDIPNFAITILSLLGLYLLVTKKNWLNFVFKKNRRS